MNILFIKLSAIGDVVQTLPALETIKRQYPESRITWLVEEAAAGLIEGHPLIDRVLVSERKKWMRMMMKPDTFMQGLRGFIRFIRELRSNTYDIAIDFQGLFKSGMLIGITRADRKIGFNGTRELSYLFLNERLPAFDIERHALERYLDIARHLGAENPASSCTLSIEPERARMAARSAAVTTKGSPLIVINPIARWKTKLWSETNFSALADWLHAEKNATVIFTGSREDRDAIQRICAGMSSPASNWAGETSLKELAALAALCDLFITTDTGPMHIAAAAGAKVVALFGPTAPWRTGPYGPLSVSIRAGIDCSPCFKRKCDKNNRCMEELSVAAVFEKVRPLL